MQDLAAQRLLAFDHGVLSAATAFGKTVVCSYLIAERKVNARYIYGVSATPKRGDHLEKIIFMLLGPIRHSYTAKERAAEQGIGHYVYPRYTRVIDTNKSKTDINGAYALISTNSARNEMILEDTRICVKEGRTPVILTRYKEQAKYLYDHLQGDADNVFILYGDNSDKENREVRRRLKEVPKDQSMILVATGQKIGEGFDYPRLDTLMLAAPVSFSSRLEQYIGRKSVSVAAELMEIGVKN